MKTIYTLEDIHDFLLQKGYSEWTYEIYDRHLGNKRKAKIEDFFDELGFFEHAYMAVINKRGYECCLEVHITDFKFETYKDESNVMGSGSTTYIDKEYTKDWIDYLLHVHGEEYAKALLKYAENNKQRIKEEVEEKIENFRLKTQAQAKGPYMYYRDLEQKAKSILPVGENVGVEQSNNPSCDENCLGIRYYDANTMTIRNTNGKDEEDVLGR